MDNITTIQQFILWLNGQITHWHYLDKSLGYKHPCKGTKAALIQAVNLASQFEVDHSWIVKYDFTDDVGYATVADILIKFRAMVQATVRQSAQTDASANSANGPTPKKKEEHQEAETSLSSNPFDDIEPHRHLPAEARSALWSACQLVLERSDEFADALAWLNECYSEPVMLERLLLDSEQIYKSQMRYLRQGPDRCDTFPRRMALRAGRRELEAPRRMVLLRKFWSVPELNISPEFAKELIEHPEKVRDWEIGRAHV